MRHREATKALLRASCIVGAVLLSACDLSPIGPVFDPGPIGPNGPNGPTDPNGPAGPVLVAIVGSAIPCESGIAAGYACSNVDLMSFLPLQELGSQAPPGYPPSGTPLNDIWGWTDPQTGIEYALVGRSDGLAFLSLGDPESPVFRRRASDDAGSLCELMARRQSLRGPCLHRRRRRETARDAGVRSSAAPRGLRGPRHLFFDEPEP